MFGNGNTDIYISYILRSEENFRLCDEVGLINVFLTNKFVKSYTIYWLKTSLVWSYFIDNLDLDYMIIVVYDMDTQNWLTDERENWLSLSLGSGCLPI